MWVCLLVRDCGELYSHMQTFSCLTCCYLQICNHPMHRAMWESPASAPTPPCYSSLGLSRLPGPLLHREEVGLGRLEEGISKRGKDK